jgi:hypothetical protein
METSLILDFGMQISDLTKMQKSDFKFLNRFSVANIININVNVNVNINVNFVKRVQGSKVHGSGFKSIRAG